MAEQASTATTGGRGRSVDKESVILDAAQQVFLKDGFAASVDRIAVVAGVAKQTIYSHFGSKEGLFRAVAERMKQPIGLLLDPALAPEEALKHYVTAAIDNVTAPQSIRLTRLLIAQADQFGDLASLHYTIGPCRMRDMLARYLEGLMDGGRMVRVDPEEAAEDLFGLAQGLERHRLLLGVGPGLTREQVSARASRVVKLFLKAYSIT